MSKDLKIYFPFDRATFYFKNVAQMEEFEKHHVQYREDGIPLLVKHGIRTQIF